MQDRDRTSEPPRLPGFDSEAGLPWRTLSRVVFGLTVLVTVIAFQQVVHFDFVNFDDDYNVYRNEHIRALTTDNLVWMATHPLAGHYHPLTVLSWAVDYAVWGGLKPSGFHLTNLLLHVVTVCGLLALCMELYGRWRGGGGGGRGPVRDRAVAVGACCAALFYGVHPLRVESVAWVTERRDVLCGAWLVWGVWFYVRATRAPTRRAYVRRMTVAWVLVVLSLLSKAWAITLPVVFLTLDVFPLRRLRSCAVGGDDATGGRGAAGAHELRRCWIEKVAFLTPAIVFAGLAIWAQGQAGALKTVDTHGWPQRVAQACYGVGFYLYKTVWPVDLVAHYEWGPGTSWLNAQVLAGAVVLLGVSLLAWLLRRRAPALAVCWICFLVTVSPVLGLAQSGPQLVADRYTYVPGMVLAIGFGALVVTVWRKTRLAKRASRGSWRASRHVALVVVGAIVVAVLVVRTRAQTRVWANSASLWTHLLQRHPDDALGHVNYGYTLYEQAGALSAAAAPAERTDLLEQAMAEYETAAKLRPTHRTAWLGAARCAVSLGRFDQAYALYQRTLDLAPDDAETLLETADTLVALKRVDDAVAMYGRVAERKPARALYAYYTVGALLIRQGRYDASLDAFRRALRAVPDAPPSREDQSLIWDAHLGMAECLLSLGRESAAIEALRDGVRQADREGGEVLPVRLFARLAYLMATTPDGALADPDRAIALARRAWDASGGRSVVAAEALAAGYARRGEFAQATEVLDRVLKTARADSGAMWVARLGKERDQYKQGQPMIRQSANGE